MKIYKSGKELGSHFMTKFRNVPFLSSFSDEYLQEILNASKLVMYQPDESIIREGELDYKIYVLYSGKVKVTKGGRTIAIFDEIGDIFGELTMINDEARTASVLAVNNTLCLVIDVSFIRQLNKEDQNACYALFYSLFSRILAERLKVTTEELADVKAELEMVRRR